MDDNGYDKLGIFSRDTAWQFSKPLVLLLISCFYSSLPWAQSFPSEPLLLPKLEVRQINATIVGLSAEAACNDYDTPQDTIELRDLRFSQVQTRALHQQAIAPDSALHAQLMQAARQHLQVPASDALSVPQTLCELQSLGVALSTTYRSVKGLAAPIFVIDPQEVVDGVLHMQVLEAVLEALTLDEVEAADKLDRSEVLKTIEALLAPKQGQALRQDDLERGLALLQYITGRNYKAFLSPGDQPLGVNVRIVPQAQSKLKGLLRVDNLGDPSTGQHQIGGVLHGSPGMVQGDQLAVGFVSSQYHSALNAFSLGYEIPLGYQGWRGGVRGLQTNYALGGSLASSQATGRMSNTNVYVQYPLLRTLLHSADLTLGAGEVVLRDNTASSQDPRQHSLLWSELRGSSKRERYLQNWGLGLTAGRMRYDTEAQTTADASNLNLQGEYQLVNLDFKHSQVLSAGVDLTGSYKAQWSGKNLDSYHKMSVGGSQGVRAFATGETSGDQAQLVRLELGYSHRKDNAVHRFSVFHDWAQVDINHSPLAANAATNRVRLAGHGVQWEMQLETGLSSRIYWAKPVGGDRSTSVIDDQRERVGAELSYRF